MAAAEKEAGLEEDRLRTEWIKARQKHAALKAELDKPSASRRYDAQLKIFQATEAAREKCDRLHHALRDSLIRSRRNSK